MKLMLLIFLFGASAFFSSVETAFFALRRVDFLKWKEEGNRRAGAIEKMLEAPGKLIATIFIGNEIANVAISTLIAAFLIRQFPAHGEVLALFLGTAGILILGDIAPKCIAWPRAKSWSLLAVRPFGVFSRIVSPVRYLLENAASAILRLFGGGTLAGDRPGLSEREFRALVDVGEETGTIDPGEKELIHNIFELTEQRAGEIMTPFADVFMVPVSLPYPELLAQFRRYRRSRIPVYEGERRNVTGVLHFKELLKSMGEGKEEVDWRTLVKPPLVVPASKKLPYLLRDFQKLKVHLALVVDEFGELEGIVTLEDVLEELFGDIREEHDREEKEIVSLPDGAFRVLGKTSVRRLNKEFGAEFSDEEWDTVAGLLLHEFGRLPGRGDSIVLGTHRFTVERLKGIRIVEVGVRKAAGEEKI
ncbi:MAG: HlyC/CorC family transporter [Deltaproteobacteria bacterium]|nr:HlyC/CorC family transporter [Deltaproteobacteria bacterium]